MVFAVTLEARSDARSTIARSSSTDPRVLTALAAGELPVPPVAVASLPAPEIAPPKTVAANQVATLALAVPNRSTTREEPADQFYTGSIGRTREGGPARGAVAHRFGEPCEP